MADVRDDVDLAHQGSGKNNRFPKHRDDKNQEKECFRMLPCGEGRWSFLGLWFQDLGSGGPFPEKRKNEKGSIWGPQGLNVATEIKSWLTLRYLE